MILSECAICGAKKLKSIKKQEASGILSSLGLKTPLSKILLLSDICFDCNFIECNSSDFLIKRLHVVVLILWLKMNKSVFNIQRQFWGADLADMQLISKFNKGFRFSLCVIDIFSKYASVVPLKDRKGATITSAFQSILKDSMELHSTDFHSNKKLNKIGR